VGTLADLVVIDAGYERAFEAAAGEALAAVVVRNGAALRQACDALHTGSLSGALIALDIPAGRRDGSLRSHVAPARRLLDSTTADAVDHLLDALVGTIDVVDGDWRRALDTHLTDRTRTIVSKAGDRLAATGARIGAQASGATAAALADARAALDDVAAAVERIARDHVDATAAARTARDDAQRCASALDAHDSAFQRAQGALSRVTTDLHDAKAESDDAHAAVNEARERVAREQAVVDQLAGELPGLEAAEAHGLAQAREVAARRATLDERAASVGARRAELASATATAGERRASLQRRIADTEQRLVELAAERVEAERRRTQLDATLAVLAGLTERIASHVAVLDARCVDLRDRRQRQSAAARAIADELDAVRRRRAGEERALEEIRERRRRAELDDAEARLRLEAAVEAVRRDLDTEPEVAIAAPCPELPEGVSAPARARDLDREIKLLGPINPLALEEFQTLSERHTFLETELEDVKSSRRELQRLINEVNVEIETVFAEAYADVAGHFETLFGRLFPGGEGRLSLTAPDDLLSTGIEVEAKPSGKNVKKLSLLSGGERSLTALAFLFAVFRSRPSPFYVMDEVEAALDDVNLHRFLQLVEEFRDDAQLLIVSHQKRTMEAADCLFGVTMQPGGSSRVISEKVGVR
jgi:chromosome segregation protein